LGENVRSEDLIEVPTSKSTKTEEAQGVQERETTKEQPPRKWDVYERILRVPYYVVFSRYTDRLRVFTLVADRYQELELDSNQPKLWIPALELGLGLWQGRYEGVTRQWLRWYDAEGNWVLTETEAALQRAEQAEALLEQERQKKERLLERLRQLEG